MIPLDYSLTTSEERNEYIKQRALDLSKLTPKELEYIANYILAPMGTNEKQLLTDNHLVTINKHEISYEGLVGKLENGEDGLHSLAATDPSKNILFSPKKPISAADVAAIPELIPLKEAIENVKQMHAGACGKKRYLLNRQIIELSQQQYAVLAAYKKPIYAAGLNKSKSYKPLEYNLTLGEITVDAVKGTVASTAAVSIFNPKHISALLCAYDDLVSGGNADTRLLLEEIRTLIDRALEKDYPEYHRIVISKMRGKSNAEIALLLPYTEQYISVVWRTKAPKIIADVAQEEYLNYYFTFVKQGTYKKCNKCGKVKLACLRYFSSNKSSKDGLYSVCKCCRNKKGDDK
jgi:hypothetical protein